MNKLGKLAYNTFVFGFLYLPLVVVVVYSFNHSERSLLWHGFTWQWYQQLAHDSAMLTVAWHSIAIGLLSASIATLVGTLAATTLYRYRFLGRNTLMGLVFLLIIIPDIVLAVSLLLLFNFAKIELGFWSLLLSHITLGIPFVTITVHTRLKELNPDIFSAAKDLGAKDNQIFFKIILPLLTPAIMAGWLISLTLSLDDVLISFFTAGPNFEILPLKIYAMARLGVSPEINALCSVMLLVTLVAVVLSHAFSRRQP